MHCTLYIPHLIPPAAAATTLWHTVDAPSLNRLLARAAFTHTHETERNALLCGAFGVAQQYDWPLAPLIARQKLLPDNSGYWLCATAVHLEIRRNALILGDPAALRITTAECAAFSTMLAEHLQAESITLQAAQSDPGTWLVHCPSPQNLTTTSLSEATGRDVRPHLPKGTDSPRWCRRLTEIEMLLHAHPANNAREGRGLLPVNSVWLWGGGVMPQHRPAAPPPYDAVWSDDVSTRALAQHAGCRIEPSLSRMTVSSLVGGSHFFSSDALSTPLRRGDVAAWRSALMALERDWFSPLLAALKARELETLTVLSSNDTATHRFVIRPGDLRKFWRQNKY